MIALGIDPGSVVGLVWLNLPDDLRASSALMPTWLAHGVVTKPQRRVNESDAGVELRFVRRLDEAIVEQPMTDLVVLEEPRDAAAYWSGQGQKGHRRGTLFMLGVHYAAALYAASNAFPTATIVSYPVLGTPAQAGWMPRRTSRDLLLKWLRTEARNRGAPDNVPDHCLMAFGVLLHHLTRIGAIAA